MNKELLRVLQNATGDDEKIDILTSILSDKGEDINRVVYSLTVTDVILAMIATLTNKKIASINIEDAIDVVENKMEMPHEEYIEGVIQARLLHEGDN